ncbi:saccharopine dehydrogenase-like oxidoreductase [Cylas formicarius]|uniref:saccharopine dehydrogenase-like oxidoreductase n=1 Tax=Cylas formicarius TaxID=197179 RepID=UPI00295854C2|nr:saccharopine dehydrogenase-like oxidoreductase [Cylas formicarius]
MANKVDLVLFGATGFTGLHCIPYLHKLTKENGRNLTWAVAGRSKSRLEQILKDIGNKIEADLSSTPVIVADINDYDSLLKMAQQAKVVLSCCGPYSLLGEGVVKACIASGAHYVDVTGEPEFMEKMQLEYHEEAVKKGVYAVSACGLDSIPSDLGVVYMEQQFEGTLNSVEVYMKTWTEGSVKGPILNYGTWHTLVESLSNIETLKEIRAKLWKDKIPKFEPRLALKKLPHKPKDQSLEGWAVPFPGADPSVIRRTQRYLYEEEDRRPVQATVYFLLPNFLSVLAMGVFGVIFLLMCRFNFGRRLLKDYPEIFSFGMCSKKSPSEEMIENTWFQLNLYGEGWKEKLADKNDQYTTPVNQRIAGKVKGRNPGYGATCIALILSAITILTEKDKLAGNGKGGVYSPGATFFKTSLVKQLNENKVTFEIIETQAVAK